MQSKKGILGLETVRVVIIFLLILAVTAIAVFLALDAVGGALSATESFTNTVTNESVWINATTYTIDRAGDANFSSWSATTVINWSDFSTIGSGNYTVDAAAGTIVGSAGRTANWSLANVTYAYAYTEPSDTQSIIGNVTDATTDFFSNSSTFMVLLAVVVILLIVALVLVAVGRFGAMGGGREF